MTHLILHAQTICNGHETLGVVVLIVGCVVALATGAGRVGR